MIRGIITTIFVTLSIIVNAQDFDALIGKANSIFFDKKYETACEEYKKILDSGIGDSIQRSWVYGYTGVCYQELGKIEEAKKAYLQAIKMGTPGSTFYTNLLSLYKEDKDFEGQEFVLLSKKKYIPYDKDKVTKSLAYLYVNTRQFEKLLNVSTELIALYPGNYKYHYFKAISYQKLNDTKQAVEEYRKVLALNSDHDKSNMNLGLILFFKGNKRFDKAVSDYEKIKKPTDADYQKCKEKLNVAKKQLLEAEPYLLKAYQTNTGETIKKALSTIYNKTGQRAKAQKYK